MIPECTQEALEELRAILAAGIFLCLMALLEDNVNGWRERRKAARK